MTPKCPVCGKDLAGVYLDSIEGVVCEQGYRCPDGCYSYEYAYGNTTVVIDDEEIHGHYTESPEEFMTRMALEKELVGRAKGKRGVK